MNQIENIFVSGDAIGVDTLSQRSVRMNRIKMGEVFQLQHNRYALVCIHCSQEFQYFTEFTLHIEEHYKKTFLQSLTSEAPVDEIKEEIEVRDTHANSPIDEKANLADDDFDNAAAFDDHFDNSYCSDAEVKAEPLQKVFKKNKKEEISAPTMTADNDELLMKIKTESLYQKEFEVFRTELLNDLVAVDVKDTPEARLISKYAIRNYTFEQKNKRYVCPLCRNTFTSTRSARRHIYVHANGKLFSCCVCKSEFAQPRYVHDHMRNRQCVKNFECFICHQRLSTSKSVKEHMRLHSKIKYNCKYCRKLFTTQRYRQRHMLRLHPYGKQRQYVAPIAIENPISYDDERPTITSYECYLCRKDYRLRRQLRNHMKLHVLQPLLCLVCGRLCSSNTSLNRHMKLHNDDTTKRHKCTLCNKSYRHRQYLLVHNRTAHKLLVDNTPPQCEICGEMFQNKRLMYQHMRIHPYEEARKFICEICNHASKNSYDLNRHMDTHSDDRSFECDVCHKKFHPRYAPVHMKIHSDIKKHKCKECGKRFRRPYALKQHMSLHGEGPAHQCDICNKVFSRSDKLLHHRRGHGFRMNYHCSICQRGFIEVKSFRKHERRAHRNEVQVKND